MHGLQELCQSEAKCEYWGFDLENSECHLREWYGWPQSNTTWASGPAFCPKGYTEMNVNPEGFVVTFSSKYESITLYNTYWLYDQIGSVVNYRLVPICINQLIS